MSHKELLHELKTKPQISINLCSVLHGTPYYTIVVSAKLDTCAHMKLHFS
jgi:hypothetical protein